MSNNSYGQFCPVAMAAEILCTRWTIVMLREMMAGSARFNDIRRGVPRMSPALLSQRLKELEEAGVVTRRRARGEPGVMEYRLTLAGEELIPIVDGFGVWGQRWVSSELTLENLDVTLLMWSMRRHIQPVPAPERNYVIQFQFQYPELAPAKRNWWLLVDPEDGADLCSIDPGRDVDLYVTSDLRAMTAVFMGLEDVRKALKSGKIVLTGDRKLGANLQNWIGYSKFAGKQAA